ncbi:CPBP family intramembrane metalloprotease [Paenibacillaceae bacterium]|nr:CPBP family intramembrane metalloprotease [Paenibacillaceae bacterium]
MIGKIVLSFIVVMILMVFAGLIIALMGAASGLDQSELAVSLEGNQLVMYGQLLLFIAVAWAMYAIFERKKGWAFGLKQRRGAQMALQGALSGIVLISLSGVLIWAFGGISWAVSDRDPALSNSLLQGLILFIGVAVSEEIYSRGYIQGLLRYHYGSGFAIIVSSCLFALLHIMNPGILETPLPILNLLMAGVIMALARELTGGLWWPIGLHLTWNYFQGYIYGFNVSGTVPEHSVLITADNGPDWLSGGQFGIEGSLISLVMLVLGTIMVYLLYRKNAQATFSSRARL